MTWVPTILQGRKLSISGIIHPKRSKQGGAQWDVLSAEPKLLAWWLCHPCPTRSAGAFGHVRWSRRLGCGVLGKLLLSYNLVCPFKKAGFEASFDHFTHKLLPLWVSPPHRLSCGCYRHKRSLMGPVICLSLSAHASDGWMVWVPQEMLFEGMRADPAVALSDTSHTFCCAVTDILTSYTWSSLFRV